MASTPIYTYRDAMLTVIDFLEGNVKEKASRDARRAVLNAYREVATAARWSYFYQRGRLDTDAAYSTGTIAYTNSSRVLTLTSGTWPDWAALGQVMIANVIYDIASRDSNSQLTLSEICNPGADVASGTSYTLFRSTYPLPSNFVAMSVLFESTNTYFPSYVDPSDWLDRSRAFRNPSVPEIYSIAADPKYYGTLGVSFNPPPSTAWHYDYMYVRRPRDLKIEEESDGTVSVTASSAGVTGVGTAFTSDMIGSTIRISSDSEHKPEGAEWQRPYDQQRTIIAVSSATAATVDNTWDTSRTGVKYIVSDPIDMDQAMLNAFWRNCEYQVALSKSLKTLPRVQESYQRALILAREADSRSFVEVTAGAPVRWKVPVKYWPYTAPTP